MPKKTKSALLSKTPEEIEIFQYLLKQNLNQPMGYKELCEAIDLPIKSSNSKTKQLNELEMFCAIKKLSSPTRYVIIEVYDEVMPFFKAFNKSSEMQLVFEGCLYQEFYNNGCQPIYLSSMQLLKLFTQINDNFSFAYNDEKMEEVSKKTSVDYTYMPTIAKRVYIFLKDWADRMVANMVKRSAIDVQYGYRLYRVIEVKGKPIHQTKDIPVGTDEHKQCMAIYENNIVKFFGRNWNGGWVDNVLWNNFQKAVNADIQELYNGEWKEMKRVKVYSPSTADRVRANLLDISQTLCGSNLINEETKHRILNKSHSGIDYAKDKQGNISDTGVTVFQKEQFVKINIDLHPPISFRNILYKQD